jgi:quercetin dioxygenase-like cupin family protein
MHLNEDAELKAHASPGCVVLMCVIANCVWTKHSGEFVEIEPKVVHRLVAIAMSDNAHVLIMYVQEGRGRVAE